MSEQPLTVTGSGMVTGVGLTAPTTCAAIRAGINNFKETRFIDSSGEWIVGSEVPLDPPCRGVQKLALMLAAVIRETLAADPSLRDGETPVIVCLSERERPGRPEGLRSELLEQLARLVALPSESMIISQGRVGAVVALREARRMIYGDRREAVIIAGVDSYLHAATLAAYERKRRLLTSTNSDGFIPGEGAAAFVVRRPAASDEPQLMVLGIGFAVEKATVESDEPLRGEGMSAAIRGALSEARASMAAVDYRITDISGEQYAFKEAALALSKLLRVRKAQFDLWHPADCIGEVGAAAGPAIVNVAYAATKKGYSKGPNILCHFGNDDGKRAAAVLTYQAVTSRG